ncbi:pilus assembly FimT family protein [Clostridium beijerinckii]|uniref:pilus assembly FimT family protein n=1 Tax=Clostridium beijerinckii TaxID=1520 RepID=UPI0022E1789F|nr:type II secretion system protein [Clostridium beijerinckii]
MKKKKLGFTLLEMIIVIALVTVILGITSSIFITGNRVFSDSDVKSTLQMEARDIQEELTSVGMQGIGIADIKIDSSNKDDDGLYVDKEYSELKSIINEAKVNLRDTNRELKIIYEVTGYDKNSEYFRNVDGSYTMSTPEVYDIEFYNNTISINSKILSRHVKSLDVIPQGVNDNFADSSSIEFDIVLNQEKAFSNVEYPFKVRVTFRNRRNN